MKHISRGDDVLVDGVWYPVIGYSMMIEANGGKSGSVFTLKPYGRYEPWLGYRIDVKDVEDVRQVSNA